MNRDAICACLVASVLIFPDSSFCQSTSIATQRSQWYASFESRWIQREDPESDDLIDQQVGYLGYTSKPVRYGWFHLGIKARRTAYSSSQDALLEPATLYLTAAAEVIPRWLYLQAGFLVPFSLPQADTSGAVQLSKVLNGIPVFADANFLPLNGISLGAGLERRMGNFHARLGVSYTGPNGYALYEGIFNDPATWLGLRTQCDWLLGNYLHRWEVDWVRYTAEIEHKGGEREVHREGDLFQGRYGFRLNWGRGALGAAVGLAYQGADRNRLRSGDDVPLVRESPNSNLQRAYLEIAWLRPAFGGGLFQLRAVPEALWRRVNATTGHLTHLEAAYRFAVGSRHVIEVSGRGLYGSFGDDGYAGGGARLEYSFKLPGANVYPRRMK